MNAVKAYRYRRKQRLDSRGIRRDEDEWKTIKGTHVLVGEEGNIKAGPDRLKNLPKKESGGAKKIELGENVRPKHSDYAYRPFCDRNEWRRNNKDKLKPIYMSGGSLAVDNERYKFLMEKNSNNLYEISLEDVRSALYENGPIPEKTVDGWLRMWYVEGDSGFKSKLAELALCTPETRNASLNLAYHLYKKETGTKQSFEEWLVTPVEVYRGHTEEQHKRNADDVFSSFSFRKGLAEHFAKQYHGKVETIKIRPIDTFGSAGSYMDGENELLIPRWLVPYRND